MTLPSEEFELGRILEMESDASIALETMVPMGGRSIPFFRLQNDASAAFEDRVRGHAFVDDIHEVSADHGETLYALDWQVSEDEFLEGIRTMDAHVLEATGTAESWSFQLRFDSHESLSGFLSYCADTDIPFDIEGIYNPTMPDAGPWYGLTPRQRETLIRAVEAGYYSIPRQSSTQDLADEFGISDQAVTERLRRAITTLVTNTLVVAEQEA